MIKKSCKFFRFIHADLKKIIRYGKLAPLYAERIWINPKDVVGCLYLGSNFSACLIDDLIVGNTDKIVQPVTRDERIRSCLLHWQEGWSWKSTEDYKSKLKILNDTGRVWDEECQCVEDLNRKFAQLDRIFQQVKREGRLKTRKEIKTFSFRERGTFRINIGPDGELLLGGGGYHRFAIAYILNIELVPAQIGAVDKAALRFLPQLRKAWR